MDDTAQILINIYDGARQPLSEEIEWMARISDSQPLSQRKSEVYGGMRGPSKLFRAPFFNNLFDAYTVVVTSAAFDDSGWFPVRVHSTAPATVDIMVLPKGGSLNFANATWTGLQASRPGLADIVRRGCASAEAAALAYSTVLEKRPNALACFLNIVTALSQVSLPGKKPLEYYWNIAWPQGDPTSEEWLNALDKVFKQDRFFCYVDANILPDVQKAADQGAFAPEPNPGAFHGDATESYKQTQFDVSNVQLTFHGHDTATFAGPDGDLIHCVKIEPDIDYYKDLGSHGLLEVIPNLVTKGTTKPDIAYMLRWMAGRRIGVPFNPLFTVEA